MAGYLSVNGNRCRLFRFFILCASLLFTLWGCGGGSSEQETAYRPTAASTDTGSASFAIQWHGVVTNSASALARQAIGDCGQAGVASITCDVYDESNNFIARGGPWNCSDHQGSITGIPAGSNRIFAVLGWSGAEGGGDTVHQGQKAGITISPGKVTDAGTIDSYPFVPILSSPDDGQNVTANAFSLAWDSVATANQYRILVSEDRAFAVPIVDTQISETTFSPSNLDASTTYYWKISSIDMLGNESADSSVWHFSTDAIVTCAAPTLDPIGNQQVDEATRLAFTVDAEDPDGGTLTYSTSSLPQDASFNRNTRTFTWTPGYGTAGNYDVTFEVCDDCPEGSLCDSEDIRITVDEESEPTPHVVYNNGDSLWDGASSIVDWVVADDFSLENDTTLTGASVDLWYNSTTFDYFSGPIYWFILDDNDGLPGTIVAQGPGIKSSPTYIGPHSSGNTHKWRLAFNFENEIPLKANRTYWFGLFARDQEIGEVYWSDTWANGYNDARSQDGKYWQQDSSTSRNPAFRLIGY